MALLVKSTIDLFQKMNKNADPRTIDLPLIKSPVPTLFLTVLYLLFVLEVGVSWMKDKKPYKLSTVLKIYNIVQVCLSSYIFIKCFPGILKLNLYCGNLDYGCRSEDDLNFIHLTWLYFINKFIDLFDTVFFVLRKKEKQKTFLHIYHHFFAVWMGYISIKYLAGGTTMFLICANSFVHFLMYSYYFFSVQMKIESTKFKKFITHLQMIQFVFLAIVFASTLMTNGCNYPKIPSLLMTLQLLTMIVMFSDFYRRNYIN